MTGSVLSLRRLVEDALPGTAVEIMAKSGLGRTTVSRWVKQMMDAEPREAHIGRWERTIGASAPVYVKGPGKDAKRPKPFTSKQLCARHRALCRKDGRLEFRKAMNRARWAAKGGKSGKSWHKDPLMVLLYRKI